MLVTEDGNATSASNNQLLYLGACTSILFATNISYNQALCIGAYVSRRLQSICSTELLSYKTELDEKLHTLKLQPYTWYSTMEDQRA